jgi:histone deacetylase complex subunit SAP18
MSGPQRAGMQPQFIARDLGSVIVGAASVDANGRVIKSELEDENEGEDIDNVKDALKQMSGELTKELRDCRFVVGDYICAAILPPLPDGLVAAAPPPPPNRAPPPRSAYDGPRENGYGGRGGSYNSYGSGSRGGRGGRYDDRRDRGGFPQGDWSRGEAPPAPERDSYGRGRGGGRSYGRGDRMNR